MSLKKAYLLIVSILLIDQISKLYVKTHFFINEEVKLDLALNSDEPTCLAIVSLDEKGGASYEFKIDGTATFDFSASWLPDPSRYKPNVLHIGTLVTVIQPGADVLYDWAMQVAEFAPIVFDPNVRSAVLGDRDVYVTAVERWVALSSVVKVSDDDMAWLYPGQRYEDVAARWIADGVALVVVTRGADGLVGITSEGLDIVTGKQIGRAHV